jgi:hypothetical protein
MLWPVFSFLSLPVCGHPKADMDAHLIGIDLAELLLKQRAEKQRPAKAAAPGTSPIATEKGRAESRRTKMHERERL